jgi:hypothetical protein
MNIHEEYELLIQTLRAQAGQFGVYNAVYTS